MTFPTAILSSVITTFFSLSLEGQELFPIADNASSVPKGVCGIRMLDEGYPEKKLLRNVAGLKVLYGISPRLSANITGTISDYHQRTLPFDFISHNHSGGQLVSETNTPEAGVAYPYVFNSIDIYARYRVVSIDGLNMHYRVAAYAEYSYVAVPSHEAEPDLVVHTSGYGAGVIQTFLFRHFAISSTAGFVIPKEYKGNTYDKYGGIYPTTIEYGRAVNYSLSFGYLLLPRCYTSYAQTNWNIYCEFTGKAYGSAKITEQDGPFSGAIVYNLPITTPILEGSNYVDINPGIQCILKSVYRIDVSAGFPLFNKSYNHLYPIYFIGMQRYFYLRHKPGTK